METEKNDADERAERHEKNREKWLARTISPAESERLARHADFMTAYYGVVEAWKSRMIARENIDPDDPNLAEDVREIAARDGETRPNFREFLIHNGDMQRNPELWRDDDEEYFIDIKHDAPRLELDWTGGAFGV